MKREKIRILLDARNREVGRLWDNQSIYDFFEQHRRLAEKIKKPFRVVVKEI